MNQLNQLNNPSSRIGAGQMGGMSGVGSAGQMGGVEMSGNAGGGMGDSQVTPFQMNQMFGSRGGNARGNSILP